jgi:uncharacterized protein (TIGR03435 family)
MKTPIQLVPLRPGLYCLMVMALCALAPAQNRQAVPATGATAPTEGPDAFDVISIKRAPPGPFGWPMPAQIQKNPTSLYCRSADVLRLVMEAYNVQAYQISGVPLWGDLNVGMANTETWDIQAKTAEPMSPEKMRSLLVALLADKYKLRIRRETREMAGYNLVVDKGGLKLNRPEPTETSSDGAPRPGRYDMDGIARLSSNMLHTTVVNQTGLAGEYMFSPFAPPARPGALPKEPAAAPGSPLERWDWVLAAGGLRLVPAKVPAEIIVVEHVERPELSPK